jgi:hypothetical protein
MLRGDAARLDSFAEALVQRPTQATSFVPRMPTFTAQMSIVENTADLETERRANARRFDWK